MKKEKVMPVDLERRLCMYEVFMLRFFFSFTLFFFSCLLKHGSLSDTLMSGFILFWCLGNLITKLFLNFVTSFVISKDAYTLGFMTSGLTAYRVLFSFFKF